MTNSLRATTLGVLAILAAGCGATLTAHRKPIADANKCLDGLVVNQNTPHKVVAVFATSVHSDRLDEIETDTMLPSEAEVYVLGYRGALFATRSLNVELHPDTSVKSVKFGSEAQTEQAFKDLTSAAATAVSIDATLSAKKPGADPDSATNTANSKELCKKTLATNKDDADNGRPLTYPGIFSCP
jgi:hypothetical protein